MPPCTSYLPISRPSSRGSPVKPSMLQDFERGRKTEIDFINGYVVTLGHAFGVPVPMNTRITGLVRQIERGDLQPTPDRINYLATQIAD